MRRYFGQSITATLLSLLVCSANAAPAASLVIQSCSKLFAPCPASAFALGQPFKFWVFAVDVNKQLATNYDGKVSINTSGLNATLPPPHTFSPADNSAFSFMITIDSTENIDGAPAAEINASDGNGLFDSEQFFSSSLPPSAQLAPALSPILGLAFCLLLAFVAVGALRSRTRSC